MEEEDSGDSVNKGRIDLRQMKPGVNTGDG